MSGGNTVSASLAIGDTFVVASQAAMLALSSAEKGDVAIRTDLSKSFILASEPSSVLANWQELLSSGGVVSVFGRTGAVVAAIGDYTTTLITEQTNLYYTDGRFDARFGTKTTDNLTEGATNLYFTNARAQAAITGTADRITSTAGVIDVAATYVGQTSITTLGIITTGTWQGTTIADGKIASALTGKTYNGLTLTSQAVGFTIAGGTTPHTITVDETQSLTNYLLAGGTRALTGNWAAGAFSITVNSVIIGSAANTITTTGGNLFVNPTSGRIVIGTTTVLSSSLTGITLQLSREGNDEYLWTTVHSNTAAHQPNFVLVRGKGTIAAPLAVMLGDKLGRLLFLGYSTTAATASGASIETVAEANWSGTSAPAYLSFYTTPSGSITLTERIRITASGNVGIGLISPTAVLHIKAGTASADTAPLKFTSGTSMTTAEAGAVEFTTDNLFFTITTGASRKRFVLEDITLTSGRVPFTTTNGRLTDLSTFTFNGARLLPNYITLAAGTASAGDSPLLFTSGVNLATPEAGAVEYNGRFTLTESDVTRRFVMQAASETKTTAGAPYTNDGYVDVVINGTALKLMTTTG